MIERTISMRAIRMHAELQRAYRWLIAGLAFFELVHGLGLVGMGLVLLPGLSPAFAVAQRAAYVQQHAWAWRLGWLPWQLSAVSDLWVAFALIRWTRALGTAGSAAQRWAWLAALLVFVAVVPDQYAEARLVSDFANTTGSASWGLQLKLYMWLTGSWADGAYTLMTACWLLALRSAESASATGAMSAARRWPRIAETLVLLAFAAAGVANHYAVGGSDSGESVHAFYLASLFNGFAFPGLIVLTIAVAARLGVVQLQAVTDNVLVRRTVTWPAADSLAGPFVASVAGSPGIRDLLRALQSRLPFPELRSDVRDVVYLNWLVDADRLEAQLPPGLRVQRYGHRALLSALIFRHGGFGPALLGPLRKLLPSPIQCNVRAYLAETPGQVVFLANSIDNALYFAGTRLLSDGLPAHYPASARIERSGSQLAVAIDPGAGSALAVHAHVEETDQRTLSPEFANVFGDYDAALAAIVPQNAAIRPLLTTGQSCNSRIVVDAPLSDVRPARALAAVELGVPLTDLVAGAPSLVFVVPSVRFVVSGETCSSSAGTD